MVREREGVSGPIGASVAPRGCQTHRETPIPGVVEPLATAAYLAHLCPAFVPILQ